MSLLISHKRVCPTCKKTFESTNYKKIYCSKFCYPSNQQHASVKRCPICNVVFVGGSKCCSIDCYLEHEAKKKMLRRMAIKKSRPKASCLWCHSIFEQIGWTHVYCSHECGELFRRMQQRIYKLSFDRKVVETELLKFRELGQNYKLSERD